MGEVTEEMVILYNKVAAWKGVTGIPNVSAGLEAVYPLIAQRERARIVELLFQRAQEQSGVWRGTAEALAAHISAQENSRAGELAMKAKTENRVLTASEILELYNHFKEITVDQEVWETEAAAVLKTGELLREGRELLKEGWEPFAVSDGLMYFRKKETNDGK